MTDRSQDTSFEFDLAVSFAGEDRDLVADFVEPLKTGGLKVFYDNDYETEMWGEDLVEYFDQVYRVKSRYAVMFISEHYATKMWPRHERRSALARGLEQDHAYVLPVRLDDTHLDGLRPTVGYLDARRLGIPGIVAATKKKLAGAAGVTEPDTSRVPRNEIERQEMLAQRPPGWEYLLFAGQLLHERDSLGHRFRDYEMGYWPSTGERFSDDTVIDFIIEAQQEALHLAATMMRVMDPSVQELAFGAPGEPGDADRIVHMASRWNSIYEGFLAWIARLRGATVPDKFRDAVDLLAHFSDDPVHSYRRFVDTLVEQCDQIPAAIAAGEALTISLEYVLQIPDDVQQAFHDELERLGR